MVDTARIRIAKDKAHLVQSLKVTDATGGPFETYADVLVFAASLGVKHKRRVPLLGDISKEPAPISREIFKNHIRSYDMVMNLIAVADSSDPKVLASDEDAIRVQAFEEYANGGLEVLEEKLKGAVDYLDQILLLLSLENKDSQGEENEFDLSAFLPT
jgi:dnd system-associated protein 4